jgi:hypothetical protein
MMFVALVGVYFMLGEKPIGAAGLVAGAAVKLSAGILLPFAILGSKDRWRSFWIAAVAGIGILGVGILAFGPHVFSIGEVLGKDSGLQTPNNVPGFLLNDVLRLDVGQSVQSNIGLGIFVVVVIALLVKVWRGGDWLAASGWASAAALMTTTWFLPWYIVWWLPIAALLRSSTQRWAAVALTVFVVALQMPQIW